MDLHATRGTRRVRAALPGAGPQTFVVVVGRTGATRPRTESFATEADARLAFKEARLATDPRAEWAELVALDGGTRRRTLAWFGTESPKAALPAAASPTGSPKARPGWWSRIWRRGRRRAASPSASRPAATQAAASPAPTVAGMMVSGRLRPR
ncbi:MAG: hypothetical protein ACRD2W_11950 [Acidimicrobiales bacterium]